jgi:uncharacterized protein with NRDE domain
MCLIAIALGVSARWPLVIASNRDEYRDRPTLPLAVWTMPGDTTLVSGRDLRAGGTWMGSTPAGRIALLTNVREPDSPTAALSRGDLPLRWLEGKMDAADFLADTDAKSYGGCNLVIGDFLRGEWNWASNRGHLLAGLAPMGSRLTSSGWQTMPMPSGIYGLSNALLDTPWPKTQALKVAMHLALAKADAADDVSALAHVLWPALANPQRAAMHELPITGVAAALEHELSSALIDIPDRGHGGYGTLSSTLMWVATQPASDTFSATICEKTVGAAVQDNHNSGQPMVRLTWPLRA